MSVADLCQQLVIALVPLAHALPQPQHDMSGHDMANSTEHDMSGHDMGNATSTEHDMSEHGHDMEGGVDISQRPPFACAHLEVYRKAFLQYFRDMLTLETTRLGWRWICRLREHGS